MQMANSFRQFDQQIAAFQPAPLQQDWGSSAWQLPKSLRASSTRGHLLGILIALVAGTFFPPAAQADELPTLERAILKQAPRILQFAREHGYTNIGVLKFRIREGNSQPSDRNGLLNRNLAERLELALIIKNKPLSPVGIVHNASDVAATLKGATHLTAVGRKQLFTSTYPLAWGSTKVVPDAFLVGSVQITADYKSALVGISAFGPDDQKLKDVVKFPASLTTTELVEVGASFGTRGFVTGAKVELSSQNHEAKASEEASQQAALIKTNPARHPLNDTSSPVILTIQYDEQQIPIEFRDGGAFVKEPTERQKVTLTLQRRNPADNNRYAVVLRVNGENTLYRERQKDLDCTKWILEPASPSIQVEGFQLSDQQRQRFRVLSTQGSRDTAMDYGADVGTISFVVFQQQSAATPSPAPPELLSEREANEADDFAILSRGMFSSQPPESLEAFKTQLEKQLVHSSQSRGLITDGQTVAGAIRKVTFDANPLPLMAATISYYAK